MLSAEQCRAYAAEYKALALILGIQPADLPCWGISHVAGQRWRTNLRALRSS